MIECGEWRVEFWKLEYLKEYCIRVGFGYLDGKRLLCIYDDEVCS